MSSDMQEQLLGRLPVTKKHHANAAFIEHLLYARCFIGMTLRCAGWWGCYCLSQQGRPWDLPLPSSGAGWRGTTGGRASGAETGAGHQELAQ